MRGFSFSVCRAASFRVRHLSPLRHTMQRFHQPSPMHDLKFTCPSTFLSAMFNLDPRLEHNVDHITSLERSLCSNFFCCGLQLADFHALLEHFEENHVVVLAPNGKRVYPREGLRAVPLDPASGPCSPSSSRASSVSPPSPLSPQTPLSPSPSAISPPVSRKSSFTVPPVYTPFTPSLPVDPADPLLDSSEIVMSHPEPDFDFSLHPTFLPPLAPEISSEHSSSEDEETTSDPTRASSMTNSSDHEIERPLHVRFIGGEKRRMDKTISKSGKSRRHHPSGSHSKRREKMYRCPKNGCVKAYLNPNGLKYHLEKGTCKFAEDEEDTLPPKRSCPSSPITYHHSQNAHLERSSSDDALINNNINDSAPLLQEEAASHALHSIGPSTNTNYGQQQQRHHPHHHHTVVAMNPTWGTTNIENPCPHPYPPPPPPHPTEVTTATQHFEHPSSPPTPPPPRQPSPLSIPSTLGQPIPQYVAHQHQQPQIQFHYPVPTYPNGYIYAQQQQQQHRPVYFSSERTTTSVVATPNSQ